VRKKRE